MKVLLVSNGFQPNYEKALAGGLAVSSLSATHSLLRRGRRHEAAALAFTRVAAGRLRYWLRLALRFLLLLGGNR